MISAKIKMGFFALALTLSSFATTVSASDLSSSSSSDEATFQPAGWGPGHGGPGWGRGPGHGGPGWGGRPGPGWPGRPGPGWPGRPGPGGPGYPGHGGGWGPSWQGVGTACGPMQPWGTSLQCPSTNPQGMSCNGMARGTRCFGAAYWQNNFVCTNPYNGQNQYGSYIFNMYVCN